MFLRLFNNKSVYSAVFIPLLGLVFWMEHLKMANPLPTLNGEDMMPLYAYFSGLFFSPSIWPAIVGFVLVLLNSLILSLLCFEFQFLQHRTFLPGIIYILTISSFPPLQTFHPAHPATLFILLSIYSTFSTYHRQQEISSTFNASFSLSLASLFYLPTVFLFPLIWISIFVLQKSDNWRLLVIPLLGIGLPWLFTWSFLYMTGSSEQLFSRIFAGVGYINNQFIFNFYFLILTSMIILLSSLGSLSLLNSVIIRKISIRKYFLILYWFTGLTLPIPFILRSTGIGLISVSTIPIAYMISHFMMSGKKRFWREFLFFFYLVILGFNYYLMLD